MVSFSCTSICGGFLQKSILMMGKTGGTRKKPHGRWLRWTSTENIVFVLVKPYLSALFLPPPSPASSHPFPFPSIFSLLFFPSLSLPSLVLNHPSHSPFFSSLLATESLAVAIDFDSFADHLFRMIPFKNLFVVYKRMAIKTRKTRRQW